MKFAVVIFACVLAAATAQLNRGQYQKDQYQYNNNRYNNPYNNQYNNQYNKQYNNQYNPFGNTYNRYQNQNYNPYKAFGSSTPFPLRPAVVAEASASIAPPVASVTASPEALKITAAPALPAPVPVLAIAKIASDDRHAETVKYENEINPDGSYNYFYETNNGITAQAQGVPRNFGGNPPVVPDVAQGSFSWTSPEGETIAITYIADENGYQPLGKAIPQPPPIPDQIARALDYIARSAPKN
ncbi:unnamed protein product, partial [Brenthis ino]